MVSRIDGAFDFLSDQVEQGLQLCIMLWRYIGDHEGK